ARGRMNGNVGKRYRAHRRARGPAGPTERKPASGEGDLRHSVAGRRPVPTANARRQGGEGDEEMGAQMEYADKTVLITGAARGQGRVNAVAYGNGGTEM